MGTAEIKLEVSPTVWVEIGAKSARLMVNNGGDWEVFANFTSPSFAKSVSFFNELRIEQMNQTIQAMSDVIAKCTFLEGKDGEKFVAVNDLYAKQQLLEEELQAYMKRKAVVVS